MIYKEHIVVPLLLLKKKIQLYLPWELASADLVCSYWWEDQKKYPKTAGLMEMPLVLEIFVYKETIYFLKIEIKNNSKASGSSRFMHFKR